MILLLVIQMDSPDSSLKKVPNNARTTWAEQHVEDFLSIPLIREFVFRSPQAVWGGSQKEVADFLVVCNPISLLISQKCQEDPSSRDETKTEKWARKKAEEGATQLKGALRRGGSKEIWCQHSRRGKIVFPDGLPKIDHGIVVIEARQQIDLLEADPGMLPLEAHGTPIHYLTLNDFMNLTDQLRTLPELNAYLSARTKFPAVELRSIGQELVWFSLYLLQDGSFGDCKSKAEALRSIEERQSELIEVIRKKNEAQAHCLLLEKLADDLATRDPNLPADFHKHYEPVENRVGYLKMQGLLANMQFRDRSILARTFAEIIQGVRQKGSAFGVTAVAVKFAPDVVFVFGAAIKPDRENLIQWLPMFVQSAMAVYGKKIGFMAVDRDGNGFEAIYIKSPKVPSDPRLLEFGRKTFGRISSSAMSFIG